MDTNTFTTNAQLAKELGTKERQITRYRAVCREHADYQKDCIYVNMTRYQVWFIKKLAGLIQEGAGISMKGLKKEFQKPDSESHQKFSKATYEGEINNAQRGE